MNCLFPPKLARQSSALKNLAAIAGRISNLPQIVPSTETGAAISRERRHPSEEEEAAAMMKKVEVSKEDELIVTDPRGLIESKDESQASLASGGRKMRAEMENADLSKEDTGMLLEQFRATKVQRYGVIEDPLTRRKCFFEIPEKLQVIPSVTALGDDDKVMEMSRSFQHQEVLFQENLSSSSQLNLKSFITSVSLYFLLLLLLQDRNL